MSVPIEEPKGILLSELLDGFCDSSDIPYFEVTGITIDSRSISAGHVFCACLGTQVHGLTYAQKAIDAGAGAIIYEADISAELWLNKLSNTQKIVLVGVENLSQKLGYIASRYYAQPTSEMLVVGVTGTDGKTSCSQFIAQAMKLLGKPCGVLGTLGYGFFGEMSEATHTTPDAIRIQSLMRDLKSHKAQQAVMEVSSHALEQGRVNGVNFHIAVLTNLSRDHLDYHGSVENYADAKQKLFEFESLKTLILNVDDEFGLRLAQQYRKKKNVLAYSLSANSVFEVSKTVRCIDLNLRTTGIEFTLSSPWGEGKVKTALLGRFNVSNLLATFSSLMALGEDFAEALNVLSQLSTVPGRMELLTAKNKPMTIVDYAHTPKALEQVLLAIREHGYKNIITVFGCGGDRDQGKRAHMGDIAARLSNSVIVTDDNPRGESADAIVQAILSGISKVQQKSTVVDVEHDRAKAIGLAFKAARPSDAILVAGKGHEDYQLIGQERRWFSDRVIVQQHLAEQ